jgi:hypothetical protein
MGVSSDGGVGLYIEVMMNPTALREIGGSIDIVKIFLHG